MTASGSTACSSAAVFALLLLCGTANGHTSTATAGATLLAAADHHGDEMGWRTRTEHIGGAQWAQERSGMNSVERLLRGLNQITWTQKLHTAKKVAALARVGSARAAQIAHVATDRQRKDKELRLLSSVGDRALSIAAAAATVAATAATAATAVEPTLGASGITYILTTPGLAEIVIGITSAILGAAAAHMLTLRQRPKQEPHALSPPEELLCPISCELMADPVLVAETGQTYDRATITSWLYTHATDPNTNCELRSKKLVPNVALRKIIDHYKDQHPEHELQYAALDVATPPQPAESLRASFMSAIHDRLRKGSAMTRSESADRLLGMLTRPAGAGMRKVRSQGDLAGLSSPGPPAV